jgi:hypothetical protein
MTGIMEELSKWDSFYVIVGSAAGALIGLQFVVLTLIAQRPSMRIAEAGAAFSTPTIIHFGTALLLALLLRAPWPTISPVAVLCGIVGCCGAIYELIITRRMRKQGVYDPDFEDWLFHVLLPGAAYVVLALSALTTLSHVREALFGFGAATLMLLFVGIHNAWDGITYHVFVRMPQSKSESRSGENTGESTQ